MLRSLFSGVSGLRNHLVKLDVIGNNIANVNTVGFKSGRVTFKETMSQLLQGSSRPVGDLGGINPMQLGTGMAVGSIDMIMNQGGLESTGNITDVAIQGEGFFVVSDGAGQYYTRAGAFQFDANGKLVSPNTGYALQGRMADANGIIGSGSAISDIVLPFGQRSAARATTKLSMIGNLDSDSVKGTILDSGRVYGLELSGADSDMNGLFAYGNADKIISGLVHNESYVEISVDGGTTKQRYYYNEDPDDAAAITPADGNGIFKSLDDLVALIDADFDTNIGAAITGGQIVFTAESDDRNLVISSSHSSLNRALQIANNSDLDTGITTSTDAFMHKAISDDLLTNLRNASGESLNLAAADDITINGKVGGTAVTETSLTVAAGTTYGNLVDTLKTALGIVNENAAVIDSKDGSIIIQGDGGTVNEITQFDLVATDAVGNQKTIFDEVFSLNAGTWNENQKAEDGNHQATITYYDSLGNPGTLTYTFTQDDSTSNRWFWEASVDTPATISSGGTGICTFNDDGSLKEFLHNNDLTGLKIDPNNGANSPITIDIDAGSAGKYDGITQGSSTSTLIATGQDGYPMGSLDQIVVSKSGEITGLYTNGVNKTMAQLVLAAFNNPSGLLKAGDNMYKLSNNSGLPVIGTAGSSINSTITPGALEMSNVDLANEFTNMIIAQRGFQANARVISTSDDLLTELVNLKR